MSSIETRISRLEAAEEIRLLKAAYLSACDRKDPAAVRACFADGQIHIDYGAVGSFDTADALVKVYEQAACHPHMVEMHHAANPRIQVTGDDQATGQWALQYQLINTRDRLLTQIGGEYEDEYRKIDGAWKIVSTRFVVSSTLIVELGDVAMKVLVADRIAQIG